MRPSAISGDVCADDEIGVFARFADRDLRNLSHELPETIQSIEKAIDFDIAEKLKWQVATNILSLFR